MKRSGWSVAVVVTSLPAVALATPPLYTPWPCDVPYSITQGHNTGSHTDNGAWAWDIGIPEGAEASAPADGVVRLVKMDSTSGGCSSAYANDANYVIVDFLDGTEALFLHLQAGSSPFVAGDAVSQGDVVGRVGLTGWVCGAHLHFQIQQTCASWWCPSIPSTFVDFGDPAYGASLIGNNCPTLEPCDAVAAGGETIIDEQTACFERETSYWWNVPEGYDGHHYYTKATDAAAAETIGRWRFDVSVAGPYRLDVFIPSTEADSVSATYGVDGGSGLVELGPIDQSAQKGWIELGEVQLAEGAGRFVELGDNTGEAIALERRLAYDAVRLTWAGDAGGGGGQGPGATATVGSGPGATGGAGGASDGAGGADDADDEEAAGCACRAGAGAPRGGGLFALLGLVVALFRFLHPRRLRHRNASAPTAP